MCDPVTAAVVATFMIKGAVDHNSAVDAAKARNNAARQTQANAATAARNKYLQQQQQFIEESRAAQQEGYDAELAKEAAVSTGIVSAANANVTGISVNALLVDEIAKGAVNQGRITDKMNNLELGFITDTKGTQIQAKSRIDAAQFVEGPDLLDGVLNVATMGLMGFSQAGGSFTKHDSQVGDTPKE